MLVIVINKNTSLIEYTYNSNRIKNLGSPYNQDKYIQHLLKNIEKDPNAFFWNETSQQVEFNIEYVDPIIKENNLKLRFTKFVGDKSVYEIERTDFTLYPLIKTSTKYHRGVPEFKEYVDPETRDSVIRLDYRDVFKDDRLHSFERDILWFNKKGDVGWKKTQIVKELSPSEAETVLEDRRRKQIHFLIGYAKGTPAQPIMDAIYTHYESDIKHYIENNSSEFRDHILNEDDPTMSAYLGIEVPRSDDPTGQTLITIKASMLYQITGSEIG